MTNQIIKSAGNFVLKHTVKIRKYAPEILTGVAAVGTIAGTVMACKATTKLEPIIDDAKEQIEDIHKVALDTKDDDEPYDPKKDLAHAYISTGIAVVKLYAPAAGVIALSLTSMFASTGISRKRNISLAAAYAAVSQGFADYRQRVIEKYGQDTDQELKYGIENKEISEQVIDEETGKKRKVKKGIKVINGKQYSDYARIFDEYNPEWKDNAERNLYFLNCQQRYANDLLKARGYLTLNEVYSSLGFEPTTAGVHVGWVYKPNGNDNGDNYIDFGIFDVSKPAVKDFLDGYEPAIVLDFNVDGYIYDIN